jgi:hypothetical protein
VQSWFNVRLSSTSNLTHSNLKPHTSTLKRDENETSSKKETEICTTMMQDDGSGSSFRYFLVRFKAVFTKRLKVHQLPVVFPCEV